MLKKIILVSSIVCSSLLLSGCWDDEPAKEKHLPAGSVRRDAKTAPAPDWEKQKLENDEQGLKAGSVARGDKNKDGQPNIPAGDVARDKK